MQQPLSYCTKLFATEQAFIGTFVAMNRLSNICYYQCTHVVHITNISRVKYKKKLIIWLGSRVVSVLDSGAEGPGLKSQS